MSLPTGTRPPIGEAEAGLGLNDEPKYSDGIFDHDIKPGSNIINETRSICDLWAYPNGTTRPVLVLSMNEYLDTGVNYVPGEIALTSFTLENGIDMANMYYKHLDPGINLPQYYRREASINSERFGLVTPSTYETGLASQDYLKIANEIEAFIKANSVALSGDQEGGNGGTFVVFCKKESVRRYAGGLAWLYQVAGKGDFPHKLVPLESVLVVLSHGGLKAFAKEHGLEKKNYHIIMRTFLSAANLAVETASSNAIPDTCSKARKQLLRIERLLKTDFKGNFIMHSKIEDYTTLGGRMQRLAGLHFDEYPHPFFGVFMCEEQAASYLDLAAYRERDDLVCVWHEDRSPDEPEPEVRMVFEPWHKKHLCARLTVARMIYLALDVIIINYPIEPIRGKHFPK